MKSKTPLLALMNKGSFLRLRERKKSYFSSLRKRSLTVSRLVCCCWRHIIGTYVKHLEGFLLFEEVSFWEAVVTSKVGAPPTGCPQDSMMQVINIYQQMELWWQNEHKKHTFIIYNDNSMEAFTVYAKRVNLQVLWSQNFHHDSTWVVLITHGGGSSLTQCIQLTSQQVRQQGPTLLRNGVIPFSDVLK